MENTLKDLILKSGIVLTLLFSGVAALAALVFSRPFGTSEASAGDGNRNVVISGASKTPVIYTANPGAKDVPEVEYRERLARITKLSDEGSFQELVNEGDEIHQKWGGIGGERFARLNLRLMDAPGNGGMPDKNPTAWDLREKYATAALATADSFSVDSELKHVMHLRYLALVPSFSDPEASWLRNSSKLWLHLLTRLEGEKDPSISLDPNESLPNHLTTPAELQKVETEDPLTAARLRAVDDEHQRKLKRIAYQFQLQNLSETAERYGSRFLANVYSRPLFSREELSSLLAEYSISETLKTKILKARDDLASSLDR